MKAKTSFGWMGTALMITALTGCSRKEAVNAFRSQWPADVKRTWAGPELWANRLQDWLVSGGRLECVEASGEMPMRTVHLLTRRIGSERGSLEMSVTTGPVGGSSRLATDSAAGFLIGVGGELDYRAAALVHHSCGPGAGLFAGIDGEGRLFARDFTRKDTELASLPSGMGSHDAVRLDLGIEPSASGYILTLASFDPETGRRKDRLTLREIEPGRVVGNVALVSHPGSFANGTRFWFEDWSVSGSKLEVHDDRLCGPVLSTQYTLSKSILKMTAQMMPIGAAETQTVSLEVEDSGTWREIATTNAVVPGYTATFRVEDWDSSKDTPYRVRYETYEYTGTVRHDPVEKDSITLAAFTGNHNLGDDWRGADHGTFPWADRVWFPHADLTERVSAHDPDVLFFSGDQVYESASPTRAQKSPTPKAELDYLYKWYLWCWAFRDLTRNRPTVTIPDDHDVYQGNIWGAGGPPTDVDNKGGFVMPPDWVNMVQRTQTSHLPDPFDPTPIDQDITVYYTDMLYGRVSFAVIEDRKFKSGPAGLAPPTTSGRPDHVIDPNFDPATADVPEATLLGERQLGFLDTWAGDWEGTDMKSVLSQTIFANATSLHGAEQTRLVADYDSNGWPQTGRNEAIKRIRKAYAPHISGDQHLATIIHYGIDTWADAGLAFGVPSIANFYPRSWLPLEPGKNRAPGAPEYTGGYLDGLGNHITVHAAANPGEPTGREPAALHDKTAGYGIVRFNKKNRTITFECWPRYADPKTDKQYPGWPQTFALEDNYGREPTAHLATLELEGIENPVLRVVRGGRRGKLVYALRVVGSTIRPWVYEYGSYTVHIGEPGTNKMKTLRGLIPLPPGVKRTMLVKFNP
jgi:phosphodiesterase/alkaline phosphatase D-like protein